MRGILKIYIVFFIGIVSLNAQSRHYKNRKGFKIAVKNNVLSYMVNSINLSLECRVKGRHSVQGVIQMNHDRNRHSSWFMANGDAMRTSGYALGIEYRLYVDDPKDAFNIEGWYVSPYFRYIYRNIYYSPDYHNPPTEPYSSITFKRDVLSYGVVVGFQKVLRLGFGGIDIFAGVGARHKKDYDFEYQYEFYKINDFIDGNGEIRLGANLVLSNIK